MNYQLSTYQNEHGVKAVKVEKQAATIDSLINATLTKYVNNDYVGDGTEGGAPLYLFSHCYSLEEIEMNSMLAVPEGFHNHVMLGSKYTAHRLRNASYRSATKVEKIAFKSCSLLEFVDLNGCVEIKDQAFENAGNNITGGGLLVNIPNCTTLGLRVFHNSHLLSVDMPALVNMGTGVPFQGCSKLTSVNMPNLESIGAYYSQGAFQGCSSLTMLDFPKLTSIAWAEFQRCTNLATLILRADTVCTLSNANSFQNSPFASNGTGGVLYVKQSLLNEYLNATNWSVILSYPNNQILPIEGSEYEVRE